ncbi:MAG TPA: acyl-CoA dehydrogenase family protein [Acidimicrobiales bacterium]|nr:acyl-CoA dehydrogenase family protein [Acidimicrobiales bacterium]
MAIDAAADEALRHEVQVWIKENALEELKGVRPALRPTGERSEAMLEWERRLLEGRWICSHWPEEYGGRGLDSFQNGVVSEEFGRAGYPRVSRGMGESLVSPAIIVHGDEEQKRHFLARILDGTDRYCQGFSEPGAGSDLAGLQTRGVVDGDEIIITGQKVWTSGAQFANMMFCMCRTDWDAPKHQGISYVLVPMKDNGFDIRPLRQMTGGVGFNEVFIDGARAPLFNVIGGLHNGWRVANTTLGNERRGGGSRHVGFLETWQRVVDEARDNGKASDPNVRQQLAWAYSKIQIIRYQAERMNALAAAGHEPGPEASVGKMLWSEYSRRFGEIAMNIAGMESLVRPDGDGYRQNEWMGMFLGSRSGTIWGGTAEVQRNIVGERALGLPKEPGDLANLPFSDIPKNA